MVWSIPRGPFALAILSFKILRAQFSEYIYFKSVGDSGIDRRILDVRPGTLWRRLHDARRALRAVLEGGDS